MQDPWPSIKRLDKVTSYHDRELAVLQREAATQKDTLREIVDIANKTQGGVRVIQWLAGTAFALATLYVAAKGAGVI